MKMGGRRLKKIPGREVIPDGDAIRLVKEGWFLRQIVRKYRIALPRLRRLARGLENNENENIQEKMP
jgi:hypothetical protein